MIEFDDIKDGVSLALAAELNLDTAVVVEDDRHDYGEVRYNDYGLIGTDLFALTFTIRDENVRAISLRRAREKEVRQWLRP